MLQIYRGRRRRHESHQSVHTPRSLRYVLGLGYVGFDLVHAMSCPRSNQQALSEFQARLWNRQKQR